LRVASVCQQSRNLLSLVVHVSTLRCPSQYVNTAQSATRCFLVNCIHQVKP